MSELLRNLFFVNEDLFFSEIVGAKNMVLNSHVKPTEGNILGIRLRDYLEEDQMAENTPDLIHVRIVDLMIDLSDGSMVPHCEPVSEEDADLLLSLKEVMDAMNQGEDVEEFEDEDVEDEDVEDVEDEDVEEYEVEELEEFEEDDLEEYEVEELEEEYGDEVGETLDDRPSQRSMVLASASGKRPARRSRREELPEPQPRENKKTQRRPLGRNVQAQIEQLDDIPPDLQGLVDDAIRYASPRLQSAPVSTDRVTFSHDDPSIGEAAERGLSKMAKNTRTDSTGSLEGLGFDIKSSAKNKPAGGDYIKSRVTEVFNFDMPTYVDTPRRTPQKKSRVGGRRKARS
jgi:hypothetical protein